MPQLQQPASGSRRTVGIIGGGIAGVGAAVMLKNAGYSADDLAVFERADRIGGVWHHNTYPGAACDVASLLYEYSFAPNPYWSRRFAPQPEIQQYIEGVAERFGVSDAIHTGANVERAEWDDARHRWIVHTNQGLHETDVLISACGQLTTPKVPDLDGRESFTGPAFHTAEWDHSVDLTGMRVAVIGTGASAIQVVPALQRVAAHIDLYQRSPGWVLPKNDHPNSEKTKARLTRYPVLQKYHRARHLLFNDLLAVAMTRRRWILKGLELLARQHIHAAIDDPTLRQQLTPSFELGCKRIMLSDDWYPALNQSNVNLVDHNIAEITPTGITTADGAHRPTDAIIWATGFQAHNFIAPTEVVGRGGHTLAQSWANGPRAYLGMTVPGFPNLFFIHGPNTTGGSGSVVNTIECGVRHVLAALDAMTSFHADAIEVTVDAADRFDKQLRAALNRTVWHQGGCHNWYVGEDGHDPVLWPWTWRTYAQRTRTLEPDAYSFVNENARYSPAQPPR